MCKVSESKQINFSEFIGKAKTKYVFQVSWPYLGFCPTLNILLWIVSKMLSNLLENGEKYIEKCNFYIKYFDKIKCYANRPYLVFSELKPETHIYFFFGLRSRLEYLSRSMTKPTKWHAPSEDSDQPGHPPSLISLRCALNVQLRTQGSSTWTAKTLIRLRWCLSWSESSLEAKVILLVLSCCSSFYRNDPEYLDRHVWANSVNSD